MDYEEITDNLIQKTMREFKLDQVYQEFLDSVVKFNDFKNGPKEQLQKYIDQMK